MTFEVPCIIDKSALVVLLAHPHKINSDSAIVCGRHYEPGELFFIHFVGALNRGKRYEGVCLFADAADVDVERYEHTAFADLFGDGLGNHIGNSGDDSNGLYT